ncbi:DUF6382 domain-containing protein [Anaerocolumna sp. AGMB13025]|uniref:DUF6382 domain-containing protein n=1 Tax=Anaerocolumna sp. AGMB13025 TaxID=3039116 RepID=UPI00241FA20D|nr:DUF6382 domain-containing protein [Anaerocolumna sp. AGMB13025]WFR59075.1 DUF6382 domain-containing protein [Anaerocolumna sp. AGMB13025]
MMNFMGKVIEIKDTQNYAYILESPSLFFAVGYKVLLGQEKNGFIRCTKVTHNGKDKLIYDISKYKTLEALLYTLRFDTTLNVLINLLETILLAKSNGFMQCENILISPDHIFLDGENYQVNLIYLPVNQESDSENFSIFEAELKTNLCVILSTYTGKNPYIATLCQAMNNPGFAIEEICTVLKEFKQNNYKKLGTLGSKAKDRTSGKTAENNDLIGNVKKLFSFTRKESR